jgi:hypothetical protein
MAKKNFSKLLLVEGADDQHVIYALCIKYEIPETFEVIDCKGIDNLFPQIPIRFKESGIDTVGVIIDADENIEARWNKVKAEMNKVFNSFPSDLPSQGLIYEENGKKAAVWIMPNNQLNGMLENFIQFLIPEDDLLIEKIKDHLQQIESEELNKYNEIHRPKAEIHSWLACQEDPGTPMGLSITKRYLTAEPDDCTNLINWLTNLSS